MEIKYLIVFMIMLLTIPNVLSNEEGCKKTYYFIVENNWDFNETELKEFGESINVSDMDSFLNNYVYDCELKKYSDTLPQKPTPNQVTFYRNNSDGCSIGINQFLSISIPFFNICIGELECKNLKFWNYFFKLEEEEPHNIEGIRIWWILVLISIFLLYELKKSDSKLNKAIERFKKIK